MQGYIDISIHAPLAGCDHPARYKTPCTANFNPRTPCGVRPMPFPGRLTNSRFQSTHPLRGATADCQLTEAFDGISIHAPLAGCDPSPFPQLNQILISIHAPLAGCDGGDARKWLTMAQFQSTHPLRGATFTVLSLLRYVCISIHAPLAGCDPPHMIQGLRNIDFNPRTPCGVRRSRARSRMVALRFQSTHPLRGATQNRFVLNLANARISIHAPLAGCDSKNVQRKLHFF